MLVALITPDRHEQPPVELTIEGLRALGVRIVATDPGNGTQEAELLGDDAFVREASHADALLVFFGKVGAKSVPGEPTRAPKWSLLDRISLPSSQIAYLDYSEMTATGYPVGHQIEFMKKQPELRRGEPWINAEMLRRCGHYFKRECYPEDQKSGIHPWPFGLLSRYIQKPPRYGKDRDLVCCFGQVRTGLRTEIVEASRQIRQRWRDKRIDIRTNVREAEYAETVARAKVVVDAWGHGDHCYRLWEAIGARACVLYQRHRIVSWPWLTEGTEALSFRDIKEFHEKVEWLFKHPPRAALIAEEGYRRAKLEHTGAARVTQILQRMGIKLA